MFARVSHTTSFADEQGGRGEETSLIAMEDGGTASSGVGGAVGRMLVIEVKNLFLYAILGTHSLKAPYMASITYIAAGGRWGRGFEQGTMVAEGL